jgi:hypothetical protein
MRRPVAVEVPETCVGLEGDARMSGNVVPVICSPDSGQYLGERHSCNWFAVVPISVFTRHFNVADVICTAITKYVIFVTRENFIKQRSLELLSWHILGYKKTDE